MDRLGKSARFLIIIMVLISACTTVTRQTVDTNDMSYLYNPLRNKLHPKYRIFNDSDELSTLSIKLYSTELFFSEANPEGIPMAQMVLFYKVYNLSQGRVAVDTALINLPVRKDNRNREYIFSFPLNVSSGSKYEVELLLKDVIRNTTIQAHIPFDKTNLTNKNNFKVRGHFNEFDIFTQVLKAGDYINLLYPARELDTIYLKYFLPFDEIPIAPSMLIPEKELVLDPGGKVALPYSEKLELMMPNKGVYLFTTDSVSLSGYTLFNFGDTHPGMNQPEAMIEPLIYLASREKIDDLLEESNLKIALDNFWLDIATNVEKARELVRIYYNRVLYANYFFSSYKEGWRTDRGMIYIIYGPPDKVYKTQDGERWGYSKPEIKSGWGIRYKVKEDYLFFSFMKRDNPFTDNDYTIIRSESITTYWEQAVRSWQSGIVFRLDNPKDL